MSDLRRASVTAIAARVEEYNDLLPYLTYQEREEIDRLLSSIHTPIWVPFEGPQSIALDCIADELFYGGAAGGGKTDLLLGAGLTRHWRTIIFRREYAELKGIRERSEELFAEIGKFNGQLELWRILEGEFKGARIEFGACQYEGDEQKFQGRPHDLKGFDEITQFSEKQYRFLGTWNRTTRQRQRVRIIATGNPPVDAQGQWVIKYWGPWLDPRHPNPAKQGELRWYIVGPDGEDMEVDGPDPVEITYEGGETDLVYPKSRTFIRARVEDNPRLMETGYRRTLQGLPEPLRSRMLRGDFGVGQEDHEWQVIPTDWVLAAQARWASTFEAFLEKQEKARLEKIHEEIDKEEKPEEASEIAEDLASASNQRLPPPLFSRPASEDLPRRKGGEDIPIPESLLGFSGTDTYAITQHNIAKKLPPAPKTNQELQIRLATAERESAVGVDVSRGGKDETIIVDRLENWFANLLAVPGRQTKDGNQIIQLLIDHGFAKRRIQIDVTGVGTAPVDIGKMMQMDIIPMIMSEKSIAKDRSGKLGFANSRAEWWWKFREALDPDLGEDLALPPDPGLLADLTAPLWSLTPRGILVEPKEHVKARLGRSPDKGDAVVIAHARPHVVGAGFIAYMQEEVSRVRKMEAEIAEQRPGQR